MGRSAAGRTLYTRPLVLTESLRSVRPHPALKGTPQVRGFAATPAKMIVAAQGSPLACFR